MNRIRLNRLVVKGVKKDYQVTFKKSLNIIAGEISTGKTSILELIDYCFGKKESPQYPELLKKGTAVLLEIEISSNIFTDRKSVV
jgi:DNA repair ATPase RecN